MRRLWGGVLALIGVPVLAGAWMVHRIDPDTVRTRMIAEVERATGRELAVGRLRLRLFPDIEVEADRVALANPAGFSRPALLTASHVQARIALVPLLFHRVVVRDLRLSGADLKLEQPPGAVPNWRFAADRRSARLPGAMPPMEVRGMVLRAVTILALTADGSVSWQVPGLDGAVAVQALQLREVNASSTMFAHAVIAALGEVATIDGRFGGQLHLWNPADRSDWPVEATLRAAAGEIAVTGTMRDPRRVRGFDMTIDAHGPDLGRLFLLWPRLHAPRLRDAVLRTRIADRNGRLDLASLSLTAGASDLSDSVAGLRLDRLAVAAPNIDGEAGTQPNRVGADGVFAGQPLTLEAAFGPVGELFERAEGAARGVRVPVTIDATALAAGAELHVAGRVQPRGDWGGTDAVLHASIPDLAALSALAGRTLPKLGGLVADARLTGTRGLLTLSDAHVALPQGEARAEGTARLAGRPDLHGRIAIARLDVDALLAALRAVPPAPAKAGQETVGRQAGWADRALPFAALRRVDGELTLNADQLRYRGVTLDGVSASARLADGRLDLDPVGLRIGQAALGGSFSVDAAHTPPAVALEVRGKGLDGGALAALNGDADALRGTLDLDAVLAGNGRSLRGIAASLDGYVGIALTNGAIADHLLLAALQAVTPAARLDLPLGGGGQSAIACLATRLDLRDGVARLRDFLLSAQRFRLAASGSVDLGRETLDLRLRPWIGMGEFGMVLPGTAQGTWTDPHLASEPPGKPAETPLLLADSGDCAVALAAAHDTSGAMPSLPDRPAPPPTGRERAIELLRRLFR